MLCANCNREIEPVPYDRKEWYSKTKDTEKLKEAIRLYKLYGRCWRCVREQHEAQERVRISEIVSQWKAAQTLPDGLSEVDEIATIYERWGGLEAVAERLGLANIDKALSRAKSSPGKTEGLGPGVCGAHIGFTDTLVRIGFRRDALQQLLTDPDAQWRKAAQPIAYLKKCVVHNGDRAFKEWDEGKPPVGPRIMFNPYRASNWPQTNDAYAEGCRKFRATLRELGFNAAAIGVYVARICGWRRNKLTARARTPREKREIETAWRWIDRWWQGVQERTDWADVMRTVERLWWVADEILVRCAHAVLRQQFPLPAPVHTRKEQRRRRNKGLHPPAQPVDWLEYPESDLMLLTPTPSDIWAGMTDGLVDGIEGE